MIGAHSLPHLPFMNVGANAFLNCIGPRYFDGISLVKYEQDTGTSRGHNFKHGYSACLKSLGEALA